MTHHIMDVIAEYADRPFLVDASQNLVFTFEQFHQKVCSLATILRQQDIQRSERLAIILNNSLEFATLYILLAKYGG